MCSARVSASPRMTTSTRFPWSTEDNNEPELYETPDINPEDVNVPLSIPEEDSDKEDIDRERLDAHSAADVFANEHLNPRNTDFSDSLDRKRGNRSFGKGYASQYEESTAEKIDRLRREIDELRLEVDKGENHETETEVVETLDFLFNSLANTRSNAAASLANVLGENKDFSNLPEPLEQTSSESIARLEARISGIEKSIGRATTAEPFLPVLEDLSSRIDLLTSSPARLEAISSQLEKLSAMNEKFMAGRKRKEAAEVDNDVRQINELYNSLSTINSLSPLLPPVIDRLTSLAQVHKGAAFSHDTMTAIETKQQEIADGIDQCRRYLEQVKRAMDKSESQFQENVAHTDELLKKYESQACGPQK